MDGALQASGLIDEVTTFASERPDLSANRKQAGSQVQPASAQIGKQLTDPKKAIETAPMPSPPVEETAAPPPAHGWGTFAVDGPMPDPLHEHFYVKAEYLYWAMKSYHIPPLVTAGSATDAVPGALGQPNTVILFGNSDIDGGLHSGLRLSAGYWFDMWCEDGIDANGFFLGEKTKQFSASSSGTPVIARPFFDVNPANRGEFSEIVSFPGSPGSVDVNAPSRFFGAEANYRTRLCCGCDYRVDLLAGFRFLNLDEDLRIDENVMIGNTPALQQLKIANQIGSGFDDFHTMNQFYGPQVGVAAEKNWGNWSLEGRAKLALGVTAEEVRINGAQTFTPNSALNAVGDLLALPSNIGSASRARFAAVPELDFNVGYQFNDHLRAFLGYDFLYWSSVVRPGDQIDTALDSATIPHFAPGETPSGLNRPALPFKGSDFWAQGFTFGIEFRW